jgi:hypothetical protein
VDHRNHWYGHSQILARYCGIDVDDEPPRIAGHVQHGWTFVHGFGDGHWPHAGFGRFVWSDVCRRRGRARGRRDYYVLGAPWNYLLELEPDLGAVPEREGTIWYPFHGWDTNDLDGDHYRLINEIKAVETGPVTVCLYWLEYQSRHIRRIYESAGFRVICHGHRDDEDFLYNQLTELRRHRRVASNRLTTAIFYGISAGCEPAVYGDPMLMDGVNPLYEGKDRVPRLLPELHGTAIDLSVARELTRQELGSDYLATPAELLEVFGWSMMNESACQ